MDHGLYRSPWIDRRIDVLPQHSPRYAYASRGKTASLRTSQYITTTWYLRSCWNYTDLQATYRFSNAHKLSFSADWRL